MSTAFKWLLDALPQPMMVTLLPDWKSGSSVATSGIFTGLPSML
jgi:hypothetical protein